MSVDDDDRTRLREVESTLRGLKDRLAMAEKELAVLATATEADSKATGAALKRVFEAVDAAGETLQTAIGKWYIERDHLKDHDAEIDQRLAHLSSQLSSLLESHTEEKADSHKEHRSLRDKLSSVEGLLHKRISKEKEQRGAALDAMRDEMSRGDVRASSQFQEQLRTWVPIISSIVSVVIAIALSIRT